MKTKEIGEQNFGQVCFEIEKKKVKAAAQDGKYFQKIPESGDDSFADDQNYR